MNITVVALEARIVTICMICALFVFASACGDDDGNGTLIGATCDESVECDVTGVCVTDGKDGLCTLPCNVSGGAGECPIGTYCDRQNVETDFSGKEEMTLCFPACESPHHCRSGYKCEGVSGGPGKVCRPK